MIGLLIFTLTVLTFSCQPTTNPESTSNSDSLSNDNIETTDKNDNEDSTDTIHKGKDFDKFEMTFEFEDKEQKFGQKLGVTWLTNDSIEFRLLSEDGICDTDYWGSAKNNYPDMDPELDEDENGEAYPASEYVTEQATYSLSIRISLDKDRARIIFVDKLREGTDCIPTPDLVLVKKNAR
ncbi:MAG: hypothetical protein ACK5DD_04860 [Cyclobacteriaceae bacterium]